MNNNCMSLENRQTVNCCDWSRQSLMHKYVILCLICGSLSSIVGSFLIIIYVIMRSNTSSLQYFETIPTYIPAILLIFNGVVVMCFAKNKTRFAYLIKISGGCYLVCALLSVVITVTTSVIHMNRLQTHHECVYTPRIRSCTCISAISANADSSTQENNGLVAHHFTFEDIANCEAVHGLLFASLRALFGLSVFAILICIFALMLVYQLLSHEKKKKYLQQLELRRRFQPPMRRLPSHLSHATYASSHVSPALLAHNRNHSLGQTQQQCNCSDEALYNGCFPPYSYDFLDYRSYYRNFEDDSQSNIALMGNRAHSWTNWLNWPRNQLSLSNNEVTHHNNHNNHNNHNSHNSHNNHSNRNTNRRLLNYILRRNNNNNNNNNERIGESNGINPNTMQWRSLNAHHFLPPHVFIPRIGSALSTFPMPLRYGENNSHNLRANLLSAMSSAHRRTRSNDGIFHHLNVGLVSNPIDNISCPTSATNVSSNVFALWGPPPPYTCSQPQSLNRINTICNNMNRSSVGQQRRESSIHSSDNNQASKMSTPIAERRILCNAFASQGIRLTIDGKESNLMNPLKPKSKSSCIVEIHVPYNEEQHSHEIQEIEGMTNIQKRLQNSFNTLPNIKRNESSQHFKSLSNIPIIFPNKINCNQNFESKATLNDSEFQLNKTRLEAIRTVYCSEMSEPKSSLTSSKPITTSDTTAEITSELLTDNTGNSTSATSFPVDPPTDYKSTLIIQTPNTQSSPIESNNKSSNFAERQVINVQLNNAQSMPNLSCIIPVSTSKSNTSTRSHPHYWELERIPSSGNTSTSQDFADFELEFDDEPIKFVNDLPNDLSKMQSSSNSLSAIKSDSETCSLTPEFIQPPTPFNNQNYLSTTYSATISSLNDPKPDIMINIKSIPV